MARRGQETVGRSRGRIGPKLAKVVQKNVTLSEEAYDALDRARRGDKSSSGTIPRDTRKKATGNLLEYVRSISPDEELASAVEKVLEQRGKIRLRSPEL